MFDLELGWTKSGINQPDKRVAERKHVDARTANYRYGCSGVSDTIEVDIRHKPVAETLTLSKKEVTMKVGEHVELYPSVCPAETVNKRVNWSTDNEDVVSLEPFGDINGIRVKAEKDGTAVVTAKKVNNDLTASCTVKVDSRERVRIAKEVGDLFAVYFLEQENTVEVDEHYDSLVWKNLGTLSDAWQADDKDEYYERLARHTKNARQKVLKSAKQQYWHGMGPTVSFERSGLCRGRCPFCRNGRCEESPLISIASSPSGMVRGAAAQACTALYLEKLQSGVIPLEKLHVIWEHKRGMYERIVRVEDAFGWGHMCSERYALLERSKEVLAYGAVAEIEAEAARPSLTDRL